MNEIRKPFVTIQNRENKELFWVPKPTTKGNMNCVAGFNVMKYLPFVDAINRLEYAEVGSVQEVDDDMSYMLVKLIEDNSFGKFIEEIGELIYQYVEMAQPTEVIHIGVKNRLRWTKRDSEN